MTRREAHLDALVRYLGSAYYKALHGAGSAADVSKAVAQVAEAADDGYLGAPSVAAGSPASRRRIGQWHVGDVMTTKVVSVARQASYKQIAQLLTEHHLTALPVLTAEGRVTGVVSEADLLRKHERHEHLGRRPGVQLHRTVGAKTEARTAGGLMTSPAVTVGPDALLGSAARLMSLHHIKRLPVVDDDGKLMGIVSRADLLRTFLRSDAEIAAEASGVLTDILLADPNEVHARARDGVVTLAGTVASQRQVEAAVRLTEEIDGVVAVTNELRAPLPADELGAG